MKPIMQFAHGVLMVGDRAITEKMEDRNPSEDKLPANPYAGQADGVQGDEDAESKAAEDAAAKAAADTKAAEDAAKAAEENSKTSAKK